MKIIGFHMSKMLAERKHVIKGKMNIKTKLDIEDIKSEDVSISKLPALRFDFTYEVNYEPGIGKIEIKGSVLAIDDKDEGKVILKDWKDKKFTSSVKVPLFNYIMNKCSLKAIQLEDEFSLPVHIPLPKIKAAPSLSSKQSSPANYTG